MKNDLLDDFRSKIKQDKPIRDYQSESSRIDKIKNFQELNKNYLPEQSRCNFTVYQVDSDLESKIKDRFNYLGNLLEKSYVRYQLVSGKGVLLPHRDEIRKTGIIVLLTGEGGVSEFFEDGQNDIFPDYKTMKLAYSCVMRIGENWIYNHSTIHSLRNNVPPRIAVSFGWDDISAEDLYEYCKK
jgi:hypothetical protein